MDLRGNKVYDFVSMEKNMKEAVRKSEIERIKWFNRFGWMLDDYKSMQEKFSSLCGEKRAASDVVSVERDKRSILPIPETTSGEYGWLAAKSDFRLENPHNYIIKYPNPMDEITLIKGDIPRIAAGKGAFL